MKPTSSRRARRRYPNAPQQDHMQERKFFGGGTAQPFFPPGAALNRAAEAKEEEPVKRAAAAPGEKEEKKEEKVSRAPEAKEEKKEEKVSRAPAESKEEKKEDKVSRAPEAKEEKKEEKIDRAPGPEGERRIGRAEEKREESLKLTPVEPEEKRKEEKEKKDKLNRSAAPAGPEEKIDKKGGPGGAGESTVRYVDGIEAKGRPLPSAEKEYFGARMGYDFGAVRIHTGDEAARSARDAGAKAYAYGHHLVFNEGRYDPGSHEGRRLLAHELAHVVQNGGAGPGKADGHDGGGKGGSGVGTRAVGSGDAGGPDGPTRAPGPIQRQEGAGTAAQAPTDPAAFRSRLSIALSQMTTPTVIGETLSGTLEPVLREMGANAEWINASGNSGGGAEVPVRLSRGGRMVRLRLILDDTANPPLQGRFDSAGPDQGSIRVYVRQNGDADTLATTLYHESLHLMRWLARNAPGGDLVAETGATGGRRATLEGIDPARQPRHLAMVRRHVSDLASSVNTARPASDQVDAGGIDRIANFVMEEYLTRVETEVFRLMRDSDAASRRTGASVRGMTAPDIFFPRADVDKYLFEINSIFRAADRAALAPYDRGRIDDLYLYFRDRVDMFVRRRYSEIIHGPEFP